ncbi:RtcB family protein [Fontivita pretiosa]|uniref:RtcB family protein n=1 Tax=Fontivita pretiosa TaxID=2989684 RepID=UPI003D176E8E
MTGKDLIKLGLKPGPAIGVALRLIPRAKQELGSEKAVKRELKKVLDDPQGNASHPYFGELARVLAEQQNQPTFTERQQPAPYQVWGQNPDPDALAQMDAAMRLPVSVRGALMPDAHVGYGLPIGGVLATENAIIPYAVGVDIACRMKLSVFDIPADQIQRLNDTLVRALQRETRFGVGAEFSKPLEHEVLDEDWSVSPVTKQVFPKARAQLGTSGSGNHFVEFGILTLDKPELGLEPGQYLALLSHSGSRGAGAEVARYYSQLAMQLHPELPQKLRHLAWLDLDSEPGQEYFAAMNLMGKYASANHALIHQRIARAIGAQVIAGVENHHNFAWKEVHDGRELIVHRKGATPAAPGVLGVIPGSMASPAFIVRGKGNPQSLNSAAHGAGRQMSRAAARETFRWSDVRPVLERAGVQLLSAGLDEVPFVYKDIHEVMAAQSDLVEVVGRFDPRIVKMAPPGEKPED